jgi:hypothetical protein
VYAGSLKYYCQEGGVRYGKGGGVGRGRTLNKSEKRLVVRPHLVDGASSIFWGGMLR